MIDNIFMFVNWSINQDLQNMLLLLYIENSSYSIYFLQTIETGWEKKISPQNT